MTISLKASPDGTSGIVQVGGNDALDATSTGKVTVVKRAINAPLADNDGNFDMTAKNNFTCTPTVPVALGFTNITAGQSGLIYLDNTAGVAITKATAVVVPPDTLTDLSAAGKYLLTYYAPTATTVVIVASGALA